MRIWSIHPKYLDTKGLVALWRESLLAKKVLSGVTNGYKHHPQLQRFRGCEKPLDAINRYLSEVYAEATKRGYNFDAAKIAPDQADIGIKVTAGQMEYERSHLLNKLKFRDPERFGLVTPVRTLEPHPLFFVVDGVIEPWEKLEKPKRHG